MDDVCTLQDLLFIDDQRRRQPDDVSLGQCRLGLEKGKESLRFSMIVTGSS